MKKGTMTDDLDAQAIHWFTRLRAPDVTEAEREAHAEWLAADVDHELAYARVEQQWDGVESLAPWAHGELDRLGSTRRAWRVRLWVPSLAAAAATLALAVWWGFSPAPTATDEPLRIVTQKAEQRQVMLGDGSRVHVNTDSDLEVRYNQHMREVVVVHGESLFDVNPRPDRPFVVRAGRHSVIALGTRFAVRRKPEDEWAVTVLEGRVAVVPGAPANPKELADLLSSAPSGSEEQGVILGADERLNIDGAGKAVAEETDALAAIAWPTGTLKFRQTPLREVAREISRYTLGEVRVADDVPDHPITGIIHIRNRETMVGYLVEVVPVTPVESGAGVTVLHALPEGEA